VVIEAPVGVPEREPSALPGEDRHGLRGLLLCRAGQVCAHLFARLLVAVPLDRAGDTQLERLLAGSDLATALPPLAVSPQRSNRNAATLALGVGGELVAEAVLVERLIGGEQPARLLRGGSQQRRPAWRACIGAGVGRCEKCGLVICDPLPLVHTGSTGSPRAAVPSRRLLPASSGVLAGKRAHRVGNCVASKQFQ
jgi:hypothetical protein